MVTYKPGIEYTGFRGVLARLREFVLRFRYVRRSLVALVVLVALSVVGAVVLELTGIPLTEWIGRCEYCNQCGMLRRTHSRTIVGICVEDESCLERTFLTDWLERRRGPCTGHQWITAAVSWKTYMPSGTVRASGGNRNPIWAPQHPENAKRLTTALDRLEQADASQARRLAEGLLGEDDRRYWDWLDGAVHMSDASPRELSELFSKTLEGTGTDGADH